ncbi:MAG: hypothetical protein KME50_12960 [Nostoc desertorum CM1-VF14]|jgi:hypothetical protein|nr:hypothetical protein [Nostoc desertorum CM1-VF14]
MSYTKETEESITFFLSIGDTIEYELNDGTHGEGEVLEIDETCSAVKILPMDESSMILVPRWISADDIVPF